MICISRRVYEARILPLHVIGEFSVREIWAQWELLNSSDLLKNPSLRGCPCVAQLRGVGSDALSFTWTDYHF